MKVRVLLIVLLVAGFAASLALAKGPKPTKPGNALVTTTTTSTTTTTAKPKCNQVELKGNATAGSITFTVTKANKRGRALVGTAVTLTVPAGAKVKAKACTTAGSSALTFRDLHVNAPGTG